jgi:hypothetical protein
MTQKEWLRLLLLVGVLALLVGCAKRGEIKAVEQGPFALDVGTATVTTDVPCQARLDDLEALLDEAYVLYDTKQAEAEDWKQKYFAIKRLFGNALREQYGVNREGK